MQRFFLCLKGLSDASAVLLINLVLYLILTMACSAFIKCKGNCYGHTAISF